MQLLLYNTLEILETIDPLFHTEAKGKAVLSRSFNAGIITKIPYDLGEFKAARALGILGIWVWGQVNEMVRVKVRII